MPAEVESGGVELIGKFMGQNLAEGGERRITRKTFLRHKEEKEGQVSFLVAGG